MSKRIHKRSHFPICNVHMVRRIHTSTYRRARRSLPTLRSHASSFHAHLRSGVLRLDARMAPAKLPSRVAMRLHVARGIESTDAHHTTQKDREDSDPRGNETVHEGIRGRRASGKERGHGGTMSVHVKVWCGAHGETCTCGDPPVVGAWKQRTAPGMEGPARDPRLTRCQAWSIG